MNMYMLCSELYEKNKKKKKKEKRSFRANLKEKNKHVGSRRCT